MVPWGGRPSGLAGGRSKRGHEGGMRMRFRQRRLLMTLVIGGAVAVSAIAASSASAVIKSLPNGQAVSYQPVRSAASAPSPFDLAFNNMDYNGGPVMPSNTDYMVLWSPGGVSAYPAGYIAGLRTYFTDLAHDRGGHQNVDSVSAQYNDLAGAFTRYQVTFGGVLVDTDPYPPTQCP